MDKSGTYSAKIELIDSANPHVIDFDRRPMWYVTQPVVGQVFEFYYPNEPLYIHNSTSVVEIVIRHSHYGEPTHFTIATKNSVYRVTDIRRNELLPSSYSSGV